MTAKHTPGPWVADGEYIRTLMKDSRSKKLDGRACIAQVMTEKPMFLYGVDNGVLDAEGQANAALLAAAPEMIELLAEMTAPSPPYLQMDWAARTAAFDERVKRVEAAVQKAKELLARLGVRR